MQVQLRQQLTHLLSASSEQRQDGTLEALFKAPYPRTFYLDRAGRERQPLRLPVSVAVATGRIQGRLPFVTSSSQYVRDVLFQYRLHQLLNLRARPLLQCGERGHGHFGRARFRLWQWRSSSSCRETPGVVIGSLQRKGKIAVLFISTPSDYSSRNVR